VRGPRSSGTLLWPNRARSSQRNAISYHDLIDLPTGRMLSTTSLTPHPAHNRVGGLYGKSPMKQGQLTISPYGPRVSTPHLHRNRHAARVRGKITSPQGRHSQVAKWLAPARTRQEIQTPKLMLEHTEISQISIQTRIPSIFQSNKSMDSEYKGLARGL
jgi:hypothetical protein